MVKLWQEHFEPYTLILILSIEVDPGFPMETPTLYFAKISEKPDEI